MLIFTVKNKYGYNEELSFDVTPFAECLKIFKDLGMQELSVKDTNAKEVFTILL